jgi:hypothetical protein
MRDRRNRWLYLFCPCRLCQRVSWKSASLSCGWVGVDCTSPRLHTQIHNAFAIREESIWSHDYWSPILWRNSLSQQTLLHTSSWGLWTLIKTTQEQINGVIIDRAIHQNIYLLVSAKQQDACYSLLWSRSVLWLIRTTSYVLWKGHVDLLIKY